MSLFNQGSYWYRAIPKMREERLVPLMKAFGEIVANHAAFRDIFGLYLRGWVRRRTQRAKAEEMRAQEIREASAQERWRHLDQLGTDVDAAWMKLEKLVEASDCDAAAKPTLDPRDLPRRDGELPALGQRFDALRKR